MKKFFISMLTEEGKQSISSKRVVGFLGFFFLSVAMYLNMFLQVNKVPEELLDAVLYITLLALFGSTLEKMQMFKPNGLTKTETESSITIKQTTDAKAE